MANRLSTARLALFTALGPALAPGRVSLHPPGQLVSPAIYIDTPGGTIATEGRGQFLVATFPVVCVADGAPGPQAASVDELIALVWDLSREVGTASGWFSYPLDVGGPSLRAATVNVDVPLVGRTLCDPPLNTQ
jgi:hypothetical protein